MRPDGSKLAQISQGSHSYGYPRWSPDRTTIAFYPFDLMVGGYAELWLMDADGTSERELAVNACHEGTAAWSPDGSRLAYGGYGAGYDLYSILADGSDTPVGFPGSDSLSLWLYSWGVDWSPDGTRLAFVNATGDPSPHIWTLNSDGTGLTDLSAKIVQQAPLWYEAYDWSPRWSPDGSRIALARGNPDGIGIVDADGSNFTQIYYGGVKSVAWSPDGSQIAYSSHWPTQDIFVMDADGQNQVNLTNTPDIVEGHLDWR